jgi:hypothetical protein
MTRSQRVRCATVNTPKYDPHAETDVLPVDELAVRRGRKKQLSLAQVQRLLAAYALREKATQGERDE